jgi:hypothetical protein
MTNETFAERVFDAWLDVKMPRGRAQAGRRVLENLEGAA